jgi:hypothetical protein
MFQICGSVAQSVAGDRFRICTVEVQILSLLLCRSAQIGIGVCLKNRLCVGSSPTFGIGYNIQILCGIRLMVRQELPNLLMWVRFLHSVPARLTQRTECFATNEEVIGLTPISGIDYNS